MYGTAFAVEINHQIHLTAVNAAPDMHLCGYICQTAELMTAAQLRGGREWGQLSDRAVRQIAEGLLDREAVSPFLPRKVINTLKAWLR